MFHHIQSDLEVVAENRANLRTEIMESVIDSEVRELCKAIWQEQDPRRMDLLLDELLRMLDERQLMLSLL